jgi:hypothetical protein
MVSPPLIMILRDISAHERIVYRNLHFTGKYKLEGFCKCAYPFRRAGYMPSCRHSMLIAPIA